MSYSSAHQVDPSAAPSLMSSVVRLPEAAITVVAKDRRLVDEQLEAAVSTAREWAAQEKRRGILVTRLGPGHFTVRLSDAVPFGLTFECRDW